MKQQSARGLVDVLCARDQLCASGGELEVDVHIVGAIACQTVDLVHDDVSDLVLGNEAQHVLEFGTICGTGTCSSVDEFGDDNCAHALGFSEAGFALGRNRESLSLAAAPCLVFRTDAQVDHCHGLDARGCRDGEVHAYLLCA
ncbi:hypothetical protein ASC61_02030 [Aeromicrobium sp. Root344]|nr:hypothetical protein [Aeromicrobium sp. Root344]KQV73882.1 hypothetical protein ASC61_02030 [Aeromicrobium sp. Root344]